MQTYLCNYPTSGERCWFCRISLLLLPLLMTMCQSPGNLHNCPLSGQSGWEESHWTVQTRRPAETTPCSCPEYFCGDRCSCVKHLKVKPEELWMCTDDRTEEFTEKKVAYRCHERHLQQLPQETFCFVEDFAEVWWSVTHLWFKNNKNVTFKHPYCQRLKPNSDYRK